MKEDLEFIKFYNQYKDKIYNYFFYRVNFNVCLSEDLTSEVFLKAFDKFDTFDRKQSFQAWIYRISKNHLINYYRIAGRETDLEKVKNTQVDFVASIENSLEIERIINKIKKLDRSCRDVLLMRFVDQLSNKEIAEVLEKEEGTVRTQISRALKVLREDLHKEKSEENTCHSGRSLSD